MSSLQPEHDPPPADGMQKPTEREETAFFSAIWPRALKFARRQYKDIDPNAAEDAALYSLSRVMSQWREKPEVPQKERTRRVFKGITRELPRVRQRTASRRRVEYEIPHESGDDAPDDDPLDGIATAWSADGDVIVEDGYRVAGAAIELIKREQVREVIELSALKEMPPELIAERLGLDIKVVRARLRAGAAKLRPVMKLYVKGEALPPDVTRQMNKESK